MFSNKNSLPSEHIEGPTKNETLEDQKEDNHEEFVVGMSKAFTLSIAYAARVGGVGTLTGTTPNMIMKTFADRLVLNSVLWLVFFLNK